MWHLCYVNLQASCVVFLPSQVLEVGILQLGLRLDIYLCFSCCNEAVGLIKCLKSHVYDPRCISCCFFQHSVPDNQWPWKASGGITCGQTCPHCCNGLHCGCPFCKQRLRWYAICGLGSLEWSSVILHSLLCMHPIQMFWMSYAFQLLHSSWMSYIFLNCYFITPLFLFLFFVIIKPKMMSNFSFNYEQLFGKSGASLLLLKRTPTS